MYQSWDYLRKNPINGTDLELENFTIHFNSKFIELKTDGNNIYLEDKNKMEYIDLCI